MSFKRREADGENGNEGISEKRQRSDEFGSSRGRGFRGRGSRGRGFNGRGGRGSSRGRGFNSRGRGGFNRFNNDAAGEDNGGRGRGRGFRGRDSGRSRGFRGGRGFNRGRGGRDGNTTGGFDKSKSRESSIKVGQDAPEFNNILNDKSESISLKQYRGKYVILFIYFKDGTYGSKLEQESFRDVQKKFEDLNAVILGVSRDNEVSHANAVKESDLNYSLLADTKSVITKAYDAIDQSDRVFSSTFIISPEGKIAATWTQVYGVDKHPQEVLTKLEKIINGDTSDEKKKEVTNDEEDEENDNDNDKEDIDVDEEENDEDNDEDVEEDDDE